MNHIHLISDAGSLLVRGVIYPQKDDIDLGLASGVSQSGDMFISKKAAPSLTLARMFAGVSDSDYESLRDWFLTVSEGPRNSFTFIDGDGLSYTVRWMNGISDWQKDASNHWSGAMKLRVEGFAI
jgi:hypothetical protein